MQLLTIRCASVLFALAAAPIAAASIADAPHSVGEMKHLLITLDSGAVAVRFDDLPNDPPSNPVELLRSPGESYTPGAVLDDTYYSDRYGWLADGFITLNPGEHFYIEQLSATPGLSIYEGGMRPMRDMHTYAPIFSTDGSSSIWEWSGTMTHNWYSAQVPGDYSATYHLYIGDDAQDPVPGYTPAEITLTFVATPAPATLALAGCGACAAARRRRARI